MPLVPHVPLSDSWRSERAQYTSFQSARPKFLVKSREMWCQMKEPRMGHTKMYFPFEALSLVPQIAAFHKKLLEVHLVNERLSLRLVASEVLVKLHWVLVATLLKYLVAELACYLLAEDTLLLEV